MPSPSAPPPKGGVALGKAAGEIVTATLMKTIFSSGNLLVRASLSGTKVKSEIDVWSGSLLLKGSVVEASFHGISNGNSRSSSAAIDGENRNRARLCHALLPNES